MCETNLTLPQAEIAHSQVAVQVKRTLRATLKAAQIPPAPETPVTAIGIRISVPVQAIQGDDKGAAGELSRVRQSAGAEGVAAILVGFGAADVATQVIGVEPGRTVGPVGTGCIGRGQAGNTVRQ